MADCGAGAAARAGAADRRADGTPADDPEGQARIAALVETLQQLGWSLGRNVKIDQRWSAGDLEQTRKYAAELVALAPDVIVASGSAAIEPLLQTTRAVPVVFPLAADPVGAGYVDSLARPGRNATGFMAQEYGLANKWLELLKEIALCVTRAAVIRDAAISAGIGTFGAIQSAAPSLGVEVSAINVRDAGEMEHAIGAFGRLPNSGLIVTLLAIFLRHSAKVLPRRVL